MDRYGPILRTILEKRGMTDIAQAEVFLNPDYGRDCHDPFLMPDMERACVRLFEAIEKNQKIVIYADYDCDGIPGAVIMQDLLKKVGYKNFEVYIPQRNSEGYGLSSEAIPKFVESGVKLLITIDLGITAVDEVLQASKGGIDVIITDHHLPPKVLPKAYAILNPKVVNAKKGGASYPEQMLCGAGVAFKFAQAFIIKYAGEFKDVEIQDGWEKWLMDMAGLATLSDMVPLVGENRTLAYFGMKVLRRSPRPGLQKLLAKMNIEQKYLSEDDVGFMVTPRLNAASRMDDPMRAYELLSTDDEVEAGSLVDHLSKINDERKTMVTSIMRGINKKFKESSARTESNVIVIGDPKWRIGILGLVAGKICDLYEKPVFVWGKDENDLIKGSCRSDGSVSVVELMTESHKSFIDFGGHELAGGFTVHNEKVHFLEEALSKAYTEMVKNNKTTARKEGQDETAHDVVGDLGMVSMSSWREISKLAPFGLGNPKPVFRFENVTIERVKKFGKNGSGEHLEVSFSDIDQNRAKAISFFSAVDSFDKPVEEGREVNLLATFDLSRFRGRPELRLRIVGIM
jgi:single-stranded-DNA-specific exonuclease